MICLSSDIIYFVLLKKSTHLKTENMTTAAVFLVQGTCTHAHMNEGMS